MGDEQIIKEYVREKDIQPRPIKNLVGIYNGDELVRLKDRSNEISKLMQGYKIQIDAVYYTVKCLEEKEKNSETKTNCYGLQIPSKAKKTETISEQVETETQKLNDLVDQRDALLKEFKDINKVLDRNRPKLVEKMNEIADTEGSFFTTGYSSGSKKRKHRKKSQKKKFNKNKSKKLR